MIAIVAPFETMIVAVVLSLQGTVNPAMLAPVYAVIVGTVMAIFEPVMLAVVSLFQPVMLVGVSTPMLRHRGSGEGKGGERAQGGEN